MSNLIRLTEEECKWLLDALPVDVRSIQMYRQPALDDFQIECSLEDGIHRLYFCRANNDVIQSVEDTAKDNIELDASTVVVCIANIFVCGVAEALETGLVFGYTRQKNFCIITLKADCWTFLKAQNQLEEMANAMVWLYESVQYLMLHHKELLQFSITKEPSKHSGKKRDGKTKKSPPKKTRLYRLVHMTDEQAEGMKKTIRTECEKRKFERSCTAWGVRGHYRRYKSGKVVYIKPHVRGKEKEKYSGREYALFPKNITSSHPQ